MGYFGSGKTILSQLGITPNQPTGITSQEITTLQTQVATLQQQLNEQMEINRRLMKHVEELEPGRDAAWRLGALQEFENLTVELDQGGKISANQFNPAFIAWAIENKGLILSDDEVKHLMRIHHKVPKNEWSKFPYRGHDDYFYKGMRIKQTISSTNQNHNKLPQMPQVTGSLSPSQSPIYNGAASPPPIMNKQQQM